MHASDASRRTLLQRSSLFSTLDEPVLDSVAGHLQERTIHGGETLFEAGDAVSQLYLLHSGSIGLFRAPQAGGPQHLAGILGSGDSMGVTSWLLDRPHDIDARALRDSELLCLSQAAFSQLIDRHPRALLGAARTALKRLLVRGAVEPRIQPRTFALLPFNTGVPVRERAASLCRQLAQLGNCTLIDAELGRERDPGWFAEREREARFVLYLDEGRDPHWRALCKRQADALLWVASSQQSPAPWPDLRDPPHHDNPARPCHLLLLHPNGHIVSGSALGWHRSLAGDPHIHHVRNDADLARVARLLARRSTGLVLSGGGARGFAAIGLLRALHEHGIAIDRIGGTSMGALIAAGFAMEWDFDQLREHFHSAFVEHKPLSDWTLPLVALLRGERATRQLKQRFGQGDIMDLALPMFCVSADLTSGEAVVHRQGSLWHALRSASSIPGLLPPVLHDGHVLVDGAVINNLPTDVMYDYGMATILACDIRTEGALTTRLERTWSPSFWRQWQQRHKRPGLASVLLRTSMVNAQTTANQRRQLASRVFSPALEGISLLDFKDFDRAVELGYRDAMQQLQTATLSP